MFLLSSEAQRLNPGRELRTVQLLNVGKIIEQENYKKEKLEPLLNEALAVNSLLTLNFQSFKKVQVLAV